MNTFLAILVISSFVALTGYGVYRTIRWYTGWLARRASE